MGRLRSMLLVLCAILMTCVVATPAYAIDAQSAENGYMFNHGYYFYRNSSCPVSSVSGDFTYFGIRDPYFPNSSGGSYGRMQIYSTNRSPSASIGKRIVIRYNNAGSVRDAARPTWSQPCDLEVTFIVRRAHDYTPSSADNNTMYRPGTTEIGVATDLARGFRFTGIDYADMEVRFYSVGTNNVVPIGSMWFTAASLQAREGFAINHGVTGYVTGDGFNVNPDYNLSGWKGDAYRSSEWTRWHVVPGSYVYEFGHANGGMYGFFGMPPISLDEVFGEGTNDYEIVDQVPSAKTFPDGHYARRTMDWRAGSVLADLSTTNVMTGAIFSWTWAALDDYSDGVRQDSARLRTFTNDIDVGGDTYDSSGGAIWFIPSWAPATSVVPPNPTKTVDKTCVGADEVITYTVKQRIARRGSDMADGMSYDGFSFYDDLPYGLDYVANSFKALNQSGTNVTSSGSFTTSGRRINFVFSDNYLDNVLNYDGGIITFEFKAKVNSSILNAGQVNVYNNTGHTYFNNRYDLSTNTVTTRPYVLDVTVVKKSAYPDLLSGNSLYSLAGANFVVKRSSDNANVHTYTTTASGTTTAYRVVGKGSYSVTETARSAGHLIPSTATQNFSIGDSNAGKTLTLEFIEPPVVYATSAVAVKKDADKASVDTSPKWQGDAGDGSAFRVRIDFYPNYTASGNSIAWGIFGANASGTVLFSDATPIEASGTNNTWRYRWNNRNVIPLGSIKVTEVAAPVGYRIGQPRYAKIVDSNGVAVLSAI